ncbi:MAG: hypothetical protein M3464_10495 [Chloroflexota bacterium]|nr:hypothetical protein [Chloroflexota bacterium]
MSQHQLSLRAAAIVAAAAGALAPVADLVAKRRRPQRDKDDDDDGKSNNHRRGRDEDDDDAAGNGQRATKRSRTDEDNDDDKGVRELRSRQREQRSDEDDGDTGSSVITGKQSIAGDLDIRGLVRDRLDDAFRGGRGGGNDEPNIIVSEDGDSLVVLTNDIDFAADSSGIEVETDGISYSSDEFRGGNIDRDFTS